MVIYLDMLLIKKVIQSFYLLVLQGHVTNKNHCISTATVRMANKLGKMMISLDGLLPIMSHDPLIMWPCELRGSPTKGGQHANT